MKYDWVASGVSWAAVFLVLALFALYLRYVRGGVVRARLLMELSEQQVAEMRHTNAALEKIATALEKRSPS